MGVSSNTVEVLAATPPVTTGALVLFGMTLSDWAAALTIAYTVLLIAWHLKSKWFAKKPAEGGAP